jgi:hypothetical protein
MNDETISISGLREVQAALYSYSQQLGDRVVKLALMRGAAVTRDAVLRQIPASGIKIRTGRLESKSGWAIARSKIHRGQLSTDLIGVYLTLRHKKKKDPFYGRFLNDGWTTSKSKIPGKNFVQVAFERSKNDALRVIISDAQAGADVLARKVGF